ncbi:GTP-dependent dephospho-CoA kinase family protein [Halorhabdus amylolytica]|uniref:GTP-dependent dephospho-CoA kinase family protein n=1 Tax=Halorhabdus amylolytica TaxID=2559573 RepID=UPI0010AA7E1E|nr:GTP-dependent dephospho-CoA kinase family protein [Halorhabdus amylolytica]
MSEDSSTAVGSDRADPESEIVLELPDALRPALKEPFGPVHTDPEAVLAVAGEPLIAVGDIVTYHLLEAGRRPDVAFVDERTERSAVEDGIRQTVVGDGGPWFDQRIDVANPSATLTTSLLEALVEALAAEDATTVVIVYGEEDLATLPAILAAPEGASVVYGQPGEGMVHVDVGDGVRGRTAELFDRMDGDPGRARELLGIPD